MFEIHDRTETKHEKPTPLTHKKNEKYTTLTVWADNDSAHGNSWPRINVLKHVKTVARVGVRYNTRACVCARVRLTSVCVCVFYVCKLDWSPTI